MKNFSLLKHNLLILGSQNAKKADQEISREHIHPVQILHKNGKITPVKFFKNWEKLG